MKSLPTGSESFRRLNHQLFEKLEDDIHCGKALGELHTSTPKRIKQSSKLMNKLEQEWFNLKSAQHPNYPRPRAQAITFKLANGVNYTPDVFVSEWPVTGEAAAPTAWEVKGKRAWDDAIVKLKVAAHEWPEIKWVLVWKDAKGNWCEQKVLA